MCITESISFLILSDDPRTTKASASTPRGSYAIHGVPGTSASLRGVKDLAQAKSYLIRANKRILSEGTRMFATEDARAKLVERNWCPMAEQEVCTQLMRLLRLQRHDFINHLQVIHALLQLGRVEKALQYIEEISKGSELLEGPLELHVPHADCVREAQKNLD